MTIGTWLFTKLHGELVGTDAEGNRYYQDKRTNTGRRRRRWVIYNGEVEASRVPPDWHGWLHYTLDAPPPPGGLPPGGLTAGPCCVWDGVTLRAWAICTCVSWIRNRELLTSAMMSGM